MTKKEKECELNIYSLEKLLSFPTKVNNNSNNKKKTKHLECNCWVCKILDSVSEEDTLRYEDYNIVSATGDSIFYDPLLCNIFNNNDEIKGEIQVSEEKIQNLAQDELLAKDYNGVNFNRYEF